MIPSRVNLLIVFHSANNQKFILKYIHEVNYDDLQDINNKLRDGGDHVRLAQDTIPEQSMFVFEYFTDHLLHLAQKDLATEMKKKILKDALHGIAELHDHDIVHTGMLHRFLGSMQVVFDKFLTLCQISKQTTFSWIGKVVKMQSLSTESSSGTSKMPHTFLLDRI